MSKKYDTTRFSIHRSYNTPTICDLCDISERTLQRWVEQGLVPIDESKKSLLFFGSDIKVFLQQLSRSKKRKKKLKPHEFFCLKCKKPRKAKEKSIVHKDSKRFALCSICNTKMCRTKGKPRSTARAP